jgi:hypothetical protein
MLLTQEELIELTDSRRAHEQRKWLDARGWSYEVGRLGNIKVLRRYAEMRMGLPFKEANAATEPDFSTLDKAA